MKHKSLVISAVFSPDGKKIVTASYDNTARIRNVESDLDIPVGLFKLQAIVTTGCELNIETGNIVVIPPEQWYKLRKEYNTKAGEHYKICKYREYNFWSRFHPE